MPWKYDKTPCRNEKDNEVQKSSRRNKKEHLLPMQ